MAGPAWLAAAGWTGAAVAAVRWERRRRAEAFGEVRERQLTWQRLRPSSSVDVARSQVPGRADRAPNDDQSVSRRYSSTVPTASAAAVYAAKTRALWGRVSAAAIASGVSKSFA